MYRYAIVVALMTLLISPARSETLPPKKFDLDAIDAYLTAAIKEKGFVGLSVAIMRDGKIVFARGYGQRSLEKNLPVDADTSFAIGSVTKQFTCACILLLAEEGKLSLDDPIAKYYPKLTRAKDITLRDLMNHTSGYPDYYPLDFVDRRMRQPIAFESMLEQYASGKLDFEPGSRFSYSNTGYILLGGVIEKVSGESFGAFLEKRILKPMKMDHSRYGSSRDLPLAATGYTAFALGEPEPAVPEADGWIDAAGGMWASASDLLRWDLALVEGKVLKPESYRAMTAPRQLSTGKRSDYACGLLVASLDGETVLRHSGGVSGFVSLNAFLPRVRSGLVVLANTDHVSTAAVRTALFELLLKDIQERDAPAVPKVNGPGPKEVVLDFLAQMTSGKVDRGQLGEEFSAFLTEQRVKEGGARLQALGKPTRVEVEPTHERGGMEVASVMLTFKTGKVRASLYRTPDGKIQQLLFYSEGAKKP